MRAYPFMVPTFCLALGVWGGDLLGGWFWPWWIVAILLSLAALHRRAPSWILGALCLAAGACRLGLEVGVWDPGDLRRIAPNSESIVTVRGWLCDAPTVKRYTSNGRTFESSSAFLRVAILKVSGGADRPASGTLLVTGSGAMPTDFVAGREMEFTGVLSKPEGALVPGAFDYAEYLRRTGVYFRLQTSGPRDWQPVRPDERLSPSLSDRFLAWGRKTLAIGLSESDPITELIWAMVLGWKPGLNRDMQQPFMESGTIHVFAISGLHIALIAGIFLEALRLVGIPRAWAGLVALPLIWIYTGMTGWQASAIRSTVMMTVVVGTWALTRPGNLLNSLAGAAAIILLWDPQQLFQAGFQLSFAVVWSLGVIAPRLVTWMERFSFCDPMLPKALHSKPRQLADRGLRALTGNFAVSLAAWIGSLPLVAHYFHLLNPVSLIANLIVVPLSSFALAGSVGSLSVGAWWPWGAELFNNSTWFWMKGMVKVSGWAATIPGGCWNVPSPGWEGFVVYYGALAIVLGFSSLSRRFVMGAMSILVLVLAIGLVPAVGRFFTTEMVMIPRRSGAACWIKPGGWARSWLLDPGDLRSVESTVEPFLRSRGVNRLGMLAVTHGSAAAMGGVTRLEERLGIGMRMLPDAGLRSPYLRRWEEWIRLRSLPSVRVSAGDGALGVVPWRVLHPRGGKGRVLSADESATVIRFELAGVRILWLSQLGLAAQQALLEREETIEADWVITGVPSRGEPLSDPLLARIRPKGVVLLEADYPVSARASEALKRRLRSKVSEVYSTRESGALEVQAMGGQIHVHPWRKPSPPIPTSEDAFTADDR